VVHVAFLGISVCVSSAREESYSTRPHCIPQLLCVHLSKPQWYVSRLGISQHSCLKLVVPFSTSSHKVSME